MNPLEPNPYDIILSIVGAAFVMFVLWVLIKVGRYASKGSGTQEAISSDTRDEGPDA